MLFQQLGKVSGSADVLCVQDTISLHGEVCFPNLQFDKMTVDFGCILNDTEVMRYIHMTNTSPMEVNYHWSFALNDQSEAVFYNPPDAMETDIVVEDLDDEGADQSTTGVRGAVDITVEEEDMSPAVQVDIAVEGLAESPRDVRASSSLSVVMSMCLCESMYV